MDLSPPRPTLSPTQFQKRCPNTHSVLKDPYEFLPTHSSLLLLETEPPLSGVYMVAQNNFISQLPLQQGVVM